MVFLPLKRKVYTVSGGVFNQYEENIKQTTYQRRLYGVKWRVRHSIITLNKVQTNALYRVNTATLGQLEGKYSYPVQAMPEQMLG